MLVSPPSPPKLQIKVEICHLSKKKEGRERRRNRKLMNFFLNYLHNSLTRKNIEIWNQSKEK